MKKTYWGLIFFHDGSIQRVETEAANKTEANTNIMTIAHKASNYGYGPKFLSSWRVCGRINK
jgi:hypothetical protein